MLQCRIFFTHELQQSWRYAMLLSDAARSIKRRSARKMLLTYAVFRCIRYKRARRRYGQRGSYGERGEAMAARRERLLMGVLIRRSIQAARAYAELMISLLYFAYVKFSRRFYSTSSQLIYAGIVDVDTCREISCRGGQVLRRIERISRSAVSWPRPAAEASIARKHSITSPLTPQQPLTTGAPLSSRSFHHAHV